MCRWKSGFRQHQHCWVFGHWTDVQRPDLTGEHRLSGLNPVNQSWLALQAGSACCFLIPGWCPMSVSGSLATLLYDCLVDRLPVVPRVPRPFAHLLLGLFLGELRLAFFFGLKVGQHCWRPQLDLKYAEDPEGCISGSKSIPEELASTRCA